MEGKKQDGDKEDKELEVTIGNKEVMGSIKGYSSQAGKVVGEREGTQEDRDKEDEKVMAESKEMYVLMVTIKGSSNQVGEVG